MKKEKNEILILKIEDALNEIYQNEILKKPFDQRPNKANQLLEKIKLLIDEYKNQ